MLNRTGIWVKRAKATHPITQGGFSFQILKKAWRILPVTAQLNAAT